MKVVVRAVVRAATGLFLVAAACSSSSAPTEVVDGGAAGASACAAVSGDCPAVPPSYATDVAPVLKAECQPCHQPGGSDASKPLVTYADVYQRRSTVLTEVASCHMPPGGGLSAADRATLVAWLACGAPEN